MIAADQNNLYVPAHKTREEFIKERNRLAGRNGSVIDISGYDHSVHFICGSHTVKLPQYKLLILQHGKIIHDFTDM